MSFIPTHFVHGAEARALPGVRGAVISGPPRSGKSSLALQYCISEALLGNRAKLLCHPTSLRARMPQPQCPLQDLDEEVLMRIEFIYVSSFPELCRALAAIMCEGGSAGVVAVEDSDFEMTTETRPVAAALSLLYTASKLFGSAFLYVHSGPVVDFLGAFPWVGIPECALVSTRPHGAHQTLVTVRPPVVAKAIPPPPPLLLSWGQEGYVPALF